MLVWHSSKVGEVAEPGLWPCTASGSSCRPAWFGSWGLQRRSQYCWIWTWWTHNLLNAWFAPLCLCSVQLGECTTPNKCCFLNLNCAILLFFPKLLWASLMLGSDWAGKCLAYLFNICWEKSFVFRATSKGYFYSWHSCNLQNGDVFSWWICLLMMLIHSFVFPSRIQAWKGAREFSHDCKIHL